MGRFNKLETLNYIKKNNKYKNDLQKKYYEIKYFNEILKSHFYDISPHNINILQMLHSKKIVSIVKELFQIKTVSNFFSVTDIKGD